MMLRLHRRATGMGKKRCRLYLKVVCMFLAVVLVVVVRVFIGSQKEFQKGEAAFLKGTHQRAIIHYERAIRYYFPFNPYLSKSIKRLWQIEVEAKTKNKSWLAIEALRSLKGSLYATQHAWDHSRSHIRKAEEEMAVLGVLPPPKGNRGILANPLWSLSAIFGFFCWSGVIVAFILRGSERISGRDRRMAVVWFALIGLGYILWLLGMIRA